MRAGSGGPPGAARPTSVRSLSVALLSWEYPPAVVGGLSRHVYELAGGLSSLGHRVTVYTGPDARSSDPRDGVRVVRARRLPPQIPFRDLVPWVLSFNIAMLERAAADVREQRPDVLHAHDWLVAYAASGLRELTGAPIVSTIHATEHGRHGGRISGGVPGFVDSVERWLGAESARVIACSEFMRGEVTGVLGVPADRAEMIPNEVSGRAFGSPVPSVAGGRGERAPVPPRDRSLRAELGVAGHPLVLFAGRLEYEKGVQTLIDAVPHLDRSAPGVRVVIAGTGSHRPELEARVRSRRLGRRVRFEGFVEEERLRGLYAAADVVVVPSLYEPFGLVAVEAMACGTPVVASDTGGLREIVEHEVTGLRFARGNARSLAAAVRRVLVDRDLAARLASGAVRALDSRATWRDVAARTVDVYRRALRPAPAPVAPPG